MKVWPVISECDAAAVAAFGKDAAVRHLTYRKAAEAVLAQTKTFPGDLGLAKRYRRFAASHARQVRGFADALIAYRAGGAA